MNAIKQLTEEFIKNVTHVVEVGIRRTVLSALGSGKGYATACWFPPACKSISSVLGGPVQFCPIQDRRVPGCTRVFTCSAPSTGDTPKRPVAQAQGHP